MYPIPRNEDEGIADAQQALNDLRIFVRSGAAKRLDGRGHALRFQLENLEDMLRVVTDSRYAHSLAGSGSSLRGSNTASLDILQFIISTARGAIGSTSEVTTPSTSSAPTPSTGPRELILARRHPIDSARVQPFVLRRNNALNVTSGLQSLASRNKISGGQGTTVLDTGLLNVQVAPTDSKGKGRLRVVNPNPSCPFGAQADNSLLDDSDKVSQWLEKLPRQLEHAGSSRDDLSPTCAKEDQSAPDVIPSHDLKAIRPLPPVPPGAASTPSLNPEPTSIDDHKQPQGVEKDVPVPISTEPSTSNQSQDFHSSTTEDINVPTVHIDTEHATTPLSSVEDLHRPPTINNDLSTDSENMLLVIPSSSSSDTTSTSSSSSVEPQASDESEPVPENALSATRDSLESFMDGRSVINIWRSRTSQSPVAGPSGLLRLAPDLVNTPRIEILPTREERNGINGAGGLRNLFISARQQPQTRTETRSRKGTCTACYDPLYHMTVQLQAPCGHAYCRDCSAGLIKTHASQESSHPLRCCNVPIPHDLVRAVLSPSQYSDYLRKEKEYRTPIDRRIYCPKAGCKQFIKIGKIASYLYLKGKMKCPACSSWVCIKCKEFMHPGTKCGPDSINTIRFEALVKEKGWQRCEKCRRVVERTQGCLHMTCLCGYEFCYRCGAGSAAKCGHGVFGN